MMPNQLKGTTVQPQSDQPARIPIEVLWSRLKSHILRDKAVLRTKGLRNTYTKIFKLFDQDLTTKVRAIHKTATKAASGTPEAVTAYREALNEAKRLLVAYRKQVEIVLRGYRKKYPSSEGSFSYLEANLMKMEQQVDLTLDDMHRSAGPEGFGT